MGRLSKPESNSRWKTCRYYSGCPSFTTPNTQPTTPRSPVLVPTTETPGFISNRQLKKLGNANNDFGFDFLKQL